MDFETLLKKISYIEAELKLIKDELVRLIRGERGNKDNEKNENNK